MPNQEMIILKKDTVPFVDMLVPLPPDKPTLFVVLHGLIALVEGDKEFRAYPLTANPVHEYRLGDWLDEKPMQAGIRGTLRFNAPLAPVVKSAANSLNPKLTPVTKIAAFPNDNNLGPDVLGRIVLPRPTRLHLLHQGNISLTGAGALVQAAKVSGVVALEYTFSNGVAADLLDDATGDLLWTAGNTSGAPGVPVASLHFLSQPAIGQPIPFDHPVREFAVSAGFLGAAGVGLVAAAADVLDQPEPPRGLSWLEIQPYARRGLLLEKTRDFLRTGKWSSSEALSGDCKSCCSSMHAVIG